MNIALRRVIEFPVMFGRTLRKSKTNAYLFLMVALVSALPIATAQTQSTNESAQSIYTTLFDKNGNVVTSSRHLMVAKTESKNSEELRIAAEKEQAEKARRAVLARESAANRYTAKTTTSTFVEQSNDVKRELAVKAANENAIPWQLLEAVWQVESGRSWDTSKGSSAGAQGPMQFMPGTWRKYGIDKDGDGQAAIWSAIDSVHAAARLLAVNGANRGDYRSALFAYNHANWYVNKVLAIAKSLGLE